MEMVDGYDTLPEEFQDKVKRAIEQGHVDDADWKWVSTMVFLRVVHLGLTITQDPEMNIPGGKAFRSTPKKKKVSREQAQGRSGVIRLFGPMSQFGEFHQRLPEAMITLHCFSTPWLLTCLDL